MLERLEKEAVVLKQITSAVASESIEMLEEALNQAADLKLYNDDIGRAKSLKAQLEAKDAAKTALINGLKSEDPKSLAQR